ncbi:aldehyde dehydrogenase family protein, partial [Skermanella stibiiresistens]|uniref:aldehyde dehydrogenase family protein n=1 Tax=Skermanella stibiiresistens TaxID=913326 RepID=UPI0012FC906C
MPNIDHYIGGRVVTGTSERRADVFNPATGEVSGRVALAGKADVAAAVEAAAAALPG